MGFMDAQACLAALKQTNGNVNAAVDILFANEKRQEAVPSPPSNTTANQQQQIVLEDDPWANLSAVKVSEKNEASNNDGIPTIPSSSPHFLDDPFADWK